MMIEYLKSIYMLYQNPNKTIYYNMPLSVKANSNIHTILHVPARVSKNERRRNNKN